MKLSEIKGDRCFDVIADIIDPICKMADDKEVVELFRPKKVPEGMKPTEYFAKRMRVGVPVLLKGHKSEIVSIMATIEGVAPEKYTRDLTLAKLVHDVYDMLTDAELVSFFPSAPMTETVSGKASETTEAPETAAPSLDMC